MVRLSILKQWRNKLKKSLLSTSVHSRGHLKGSTLPTPAVHTRQSGTGCETERPTPPPRVPPSPFLWFCISTFRSLWLLDYLRQRFLDTDSFQAAWEWARASEMDSYGVLYSNCWIIYTVLGGAIFRLLSSGRHLAYCFYPSQMALERSLTQVC